MEFDSFDWDKHNREKILKKHKIPSEQVEQIFLNNTLFIIDDTKHSNLEKRFIAFGLTDNNIPIMAGFTLRKKNSLVLIRPITARKMSKKERRMYEEKITKIKK